MLSVEFIKSLREGGFRSPGALLNLGGEWLGSIRSWIQTRAFNGEQVTWGSEEFLRLKTLTVRDMEYCAASIASATLSEYSYQICTENEVRALRIYKNPVNWRVNSVGEMVFCPTEGLHFVHGTLGVKNGFDVLTEPDEILKKIREENDN